MKFSDFDFLLLAFSTKSNILLTVDCPNSFVTLISNNPFWFIHPLNISSFSFTSLGKDSPVKADVSSFDECENLVKEAIAKFGKIDVLVNNAGITKDGLIAMMKEDAFDRVIDINLKGTFNMTRNVVPYMMKKRCGNIVNISSVVGVIGNAGQSNYAASKAGIIGFTKSLAKELSARNIRVNAVAPGFIDTDMTSVLTDKVKENIYAQIPLKRMGEAKEVANVVYFLSDDESSYITGQVINVDGGMVM